MALILASGSPRRRELLGMLGYDFHVRTADIDEALDASAEPEKEVARICRAKALAVAPLCAPDDVVIAADTVVCFDRQILGKPHSEADAFRMLRMLSGQTHQVRTGITVCRGTDIRTAVETTEVRFRTLTDTEIFGYIRSGEPMDKAGAYGIQGLASVFVEAISGDYFNVVGLPLCRLSLLLQDFGIPLPCSRL